MQNNRRSFIKLVALSVGALAFPVKGAFAAVKVQRSAVSFSAVLKISYENYVAEFINKDNPFFSQFLNQAVKDGRIKLVPLADSVELINDDGSVNRYETQNLRLPHTWTHDDERKNSTEKQMIALAGALIQNGTDSSDWHFEELLKEHDLIVASDYRYVVSPVYDIENQRARYMTVSTAFAKLPKGTFARRAAAMEG